MPLTDPVARAAWNRDWAKRNPEKTRASSAAYCRSHSAEVRARSAAYYATHRDERRAAHKAHYLVHRDERLAQYRVQREERLSYLRTSKYGLSPDQYAELLRRYPVCAICGASAGRRALDIDHNHATGAVRGLLCENCNKGLGGFRDDLARLRAAAAYLESFEL